MTVAHIWFDNHIIDADIHDFQSSILFGFKLEEKKIFV
jgi:hypothetical protein